jgi:hypothetical protein
MLIITGSRSTREVVGRVRDVIQELGFGSRLFPLARAPLVREACVAREEETEA